MHQVRTKISWASNPKDRIHVGSIQIHQSPGAMHRGCDLFDLGIKEPQCIGIGEHKDGRLLIELASQILKINQPPRIAFHGLRFQSRHRRAGRIRSVGRVGREHHRTIFPATAEIRRRNHQCRELAMGTRRRLQRDTRQSADLGK